MNEDTSQLHDKQLRNDRAIGQERQEVKDKFVDKVKNKFTG